MYFIIGQINFYFGDGPTGCLRRAAIYFLKCAALHILLVVKNSSEFNVWRHCVYLKDILNLNGFRNPATK
jgi:hypothetical protein